MVNLSQDWVQTVGVPDRYLGFDGLKVMWAFVDYKLILRQNSKFKGTIGGLFRCRAEVRTKID